MSTLKKDIALLQIGMYRPIPGFFPHVACREEPGGIVAA